MIRKLSLTFAAAFVVFALQTAAQANTITFSGGFGVTATVSNYSLNAAGDKFTFTITNTSPSGSITAIGFNLPGDRPNFMLVSGTNSNFSLANDVSATAGAQNITNNFDFALITNNNFNGGTVSEGIWVGVQASAGQNTATFTVMGNFAGLTADQIAQSIILRFQGIGPRDESTIATPNPNNPIPEPMTMVLFGTGLAGAAAAARRRRKGAAAQTE
jgi:hypothetical protein